MINERLYRFYSHYFGEIRANSEGEASVRCPFHNDSTESMSINLGTGLWHCFACSEINTSRGGDEYDFYKELKKLDGVALRFPEVKAAVDAICGPRTTDDRNSRESLRVESHEPTVRGHIDPAEIDQYHLMLLQHVAKKNYLEHRRGIKIDTMIRFKLGWDRERYSIPIKDETGQYCNIRRYSPEAHGAVKMVSYTGDNGQTGYGEAILFPYENLMGEDIIIHEGEMDTLLSIQLGFNSITVTGGAGSWSDPWNELFRGKNVFICYDIDAPGKRGAAKIATKLCRIANSVKIINLPLTDPPDGDFTDYIVGMGQSAADFQRLMDEASLFTLNTDDGTIDSEEIPVSLSQASQARYSNCRVRFNAIVSGKDTSPFIIPKDVELECGQNAGESLCVSCDLATSGGRKRVTVPPNNECIPKMLECTDSQQKASVKKIAIIPKGCNCFSYKIVTNQNVDLLSLIPELVSEDKVSDYAMRKAYHVYDNGKPLITNRSYDMRAITIPDPRNQMAIHVVYEVAASQDDLSNFEMTENKMAILKKFQPYTNDLAGVNRKFNEIYNDFENNVTHIYGRKDLMTAIDLTYHSALSFTFMKDKVPKGLVECLIVGDTRTGKTESVIRMRNHFKLGELISGENASYAGLIGGLDSNGKRLTLKWGKFPLNDRRLLIVDEVSGLSKEIIGAMSSIRSSGVAEINKVGTQQKTQARVRTVWMSNPRSGKSLSQHESGIAAVENLIGQPEDIARFDFVLTCASDEVNNDIINSALERTHVPHIYTSSACKELLLWGWSRCKENIIFEQEAEERILKHAREMGRTYSSSFPIVGAANQRIKLAKLAVAVAIRMFSTEDGKDVIVKGCHADFARKYLDEIYRKPSLGYYSMSQTMIARDRKARSNRDIVKKFLRDNPETTKFFSDNDVFTKNSMEDLLDWDRSEVKKNLKFLHKTGMIFLDSGSYRKTSHFIEFLKEPDFIDAILANPAATAAVEETPESPEVIEEILEDNDD